MNQTYPKVLSSRFQIHKIDIKINGKNETRKEKISKLFLLRLGAYKHKKVNFQLTK